MKWGFCCRMAVVGLLLLSLAGCGRNGAPGQERPAASGSQSDAVSNGAQTPGGAETGVQAPPDASSGEITREDALAIALNNAGVPEEDAYNIKNEIDSDTGIPLYDIEFETDYGDYDFAVAMADGRIVGADYEVDEEWLDTLGGSSVTLEEAASIVADMVPGAAAADVGIWEESGDGRGRYEGELFFDGMKYEFELDPQTGIIFDWSADLRD